MTLYIIVAISAFILGAAVCYAVFSLVVLLKRQKYFKQEEYTTLKNPRKPEFSKVVLGAVLLTYFVGVFMGVRASLFDISQLGILLAYIGTPTAAAIGFYCWKAKAENIVKIKRDNPEETQGIPVDLNNIDNINQ